MPAGSSFDDVIIRSLQGGATADQEEMLERWRRRDAANEDRFRELSQLWALTGVVAPEEQRDLPEPGFLIKRAETEVEREGASLSPISPGRSGESLRGRTASSGSPRRRRAVLGALAAGLVGLGFGLSALVTAHHAPPALLSESEIETGAGEMTTISLADGTSIRLGPKSRLELQEDNDKRSARLHGRAFFGVAHDSGRPFIVHTEYGDAEVLGTRFEVRAEDQQDEFRVLVVQGQVSMRVGGEEVKISKGEVSRSIRGGVPRIQKVNDVFAQLDWLGNALVFQDTPVREAVSEIERRYGVDVEIADPSLASMTVTASFTDQSARKVLLILCEILDTECRFTAHRVRVGI